MAACSTSTLPADHSATFDPLAFFAGRSEGQGTLDPLLSSPVPLQVRSHGIAAGRSGLRLDQIITEGSKPPRRRSWIMRRVGPDQFTGTLTEAVGPVSIRVAGPRAIISYAMKDGLRVEQRIALQPGGRTLLNDLRVRKWGIRVARVEETIRKLD